jgi:hypothetical protein
LFLYLGRFVLELIYIYQLECFFFHLFVDQGKGCLPNVVQVCVGLVYQYIVYR